MCLSERIYLLISLLVMGITPLALSDSVILSNNLEIKTSILKDAISPNLPVVIMFAIKNVSLSPIQILPPCLGSMNVYDTRSVTLKLQAPCGKTEHIDYANVYIGPVREIEFVPLAQVTLEPDGMFTARLVIGGDWGNLRQGRSVFSQEGLYSVFLNYYPFIAKDAQKMDQIDLTQAYKIPPIVITVSTQNPKDAEAWGYIQRLKNWWILYDPEMRNVEYLSMAEQQTLVNELGMIARQYPESSYSRYLDYTEAALQIVRTRAKESIAIAVIQRLDALANDHGFPYSIFARDLRASIRL